MSLYLGFDTSNYTTSVAAFGNGEMINERKLLEVKKGQRGLRQSDAVFAHIKALPSLYEKLLDSIDITRVKGIGVSTKPRTVDGSYMPVFLVGESFARVVGKTLKLPLFDFSHQDGHIMAGIVSGGFSQLLERPFLSVHLSGGTTEILQSKFYENRFENIIIGGTKDISAGQLIDRVGVLLGMNFPCGFELEKLSENAVGEIKLKTSTEGAYVNFSGAETAIIRMIDKNEPKEIAFAVLEHIANALSNMLNNAILKSNIDEVLVVGGVASNSFIKKYLIMNVNGRLHFALPKYSTDNAVGIAALAQKGGR